MRITIALIGFCGALIGHWWIPVICMLVLAFRYRAWEIILLGLSIDFMWEPAAGIAASFPYFTIGAIVVVWAFEPIRSQFLS
ncbi:MAG: hypothetical protein WC050_03630 [Candidatus Paceibacterota bacterium]